MYEAAADVCIRAQDWPEALKALQQLVHLIYPALAAQEQLLLDAEQRSAAGTAPLAAQQQGQHSAAAAGGPQGPPLHGRLAAASAAPGAAGPARLQGSGGGAASWASSGTSGGDAEEDEWEALSVGLAALDDAALSAALQRRPFRRWPEVAATLALYFSCVQQGPGADRLDVLSTLRRLPRPLLRSGEVQAALRLRSALGAGDWVGLFRLCPAAPPLVQQLVAGACWARAREQALAAMAAAYRNIAVAAACRQLALDSRGLMACLKLLADRWARWCCAVEDVLVAFDASRG